MECFYVAADAQLEDDRVEDEGEGGEEGEDDARGDEVVKLQEQRSLCKSWPFKYFFVNRDLEHIFFCNLPAF